MIDSSASRSRSDVPSTTPANPGYRRVIEAQARGFWREGNSPLPLRRNKRRTFFGRSIHIGGYKLSVPVQLFRRVRFVEDIYRHPLTFLKAQQRSGKLPVVGNRRNEMFRRNLNRRRFDVQGIIGGAGFALALQHCCRFAGEPARQQKSARSQAGYFDKFAPRFPGSFHCLHLRQGREGLELLETRGLGRGVVPEDELAPCTMYVGGGGGGLETRRRTLGRGICFVGGVTAAATGAIAGAVVFGLVLVYV
jgi:hypothetical protein